MSIPGQTSVTSPPPNRSQRNTTRRTARAAAADAHLHLSDVEKWFIRRGLPHFIEDYKATDDVFNRALPLIVVMLMIQLGAELAKKNVTWGARGAGAAAGFGVVLVVFLVANLIRQPKRWYKWPRKVGVVEMTILVLIGPVVGLAARYHSDTAGAPRKALEDLGISVGVLAAIYLAVAYAVLPVILWALRHSVKEIGNLVNLASKALPMLALFGTFIFLNVDMWHIAANLQAPRLWTLVGFFGVIVLLFLMVRLPEEVRRLTGGYTRESVTLAAHLTPLERHLQELDDDLPHLTTNRRQRINMLFVLGFTQIIQVILLSLVVFVYFMILGHLAVSKDQMGDWLNLSETGPTSAEYHTLIDTPGTLFGFPAHIPLVNWDFPEALIQTALLITTFSAFFFAVSAVTDEAYRKDFFESITGKLTRSLDVRCGYIFLYVKATGQIEIAAYTGHGVYDPHIAMEDHQRTRSVPVWQSHPGEQTIQTPSHFQPQQPFQPDSGTFQPGPGQPPQGVVPQQYQPPQGVVPQRYPPQGVVPQQYQPPHTGYPQPPASAPAGPPDASQHGGHPEQGGPHTEDPFSKWPQQE